MAVDSDGVCDGVRVNETVATQPMKNALYSATQQYAPQT